jgi:processive 1,2-diacylglycerol beta-glucosyltransferase
MRVMIATATAGGGHLAAAAALAEAWRVCCPKDTVQQVDILSFFPALQRKIHSEGYVTLADHAPEVWGMVFKETDKPEVARRLTRIRRFFPSTSRSRFKRYILAYNPDVVLCTHYLPLEALGLLCQEPRRQRRRKPTANGVSGMAGHPGRPFVVSVVTDFEAHALWMDECVDLYCVAAESTGARLVSRGANAEAVVVTGIPISSRFSQAVDTKAVRRMLGIRDDFPVVLALSGGFGMGPVVEVLAAIDKATAEFQVVAVAGRNEGLRRELAVQQYRHPVRVIGFANNVNELMAVAALVVSKPGGLTTSEALAAGKPLLIVNPIPGQEAANSDFLLEHGAGSKVNRVEDLAFRVDQLLGSKKLAAMSASAAGLGRPQAARKICEFVLDRLVHRKLQSQ